VRCVLPIALLALTACAERSDGATTVASTVAPAAFWLYGAPGPWHRSGATQADFDRESRACREASVEAREAALPDERNARAYQAFLECMTERRWSRGAPAPDAGASEERG
jgi:hypothetical protein